MADAGFEKRIDRPTDALRWATGIPDVVLSPGDWMATPVQAQRAVVMSAGQARAGQILMPGTFGAKTASTPEDPHTLQIPFSSGGLPVQGFLICRELWWTGGGADMSGQSRFVVVPAGEFSSVPSRAPKPSSVAGLVQEPGDLYMMPLWFAVVQQGSTTVQLWDYRTWPGKDECGFDVQAAQNDELPESATYPIGFSTWGAPSFVDGFTWQGAILTAQFDCVALVTLTTGVQPLGSGSPSPNGSAVLRHRLGSASGPAKDYISDGASAVVTLRLNLRAGDRIEPRVFTSVRSRINAARTSLSVTVLR